MWLRPLPACSFCKFHIILTFISLVPSQELDTAEVDRGQIVKWFALRAAGVRSLRLVLPKGSGPLEPHEWYGRLAYARF